MKTSQLNSISVFLLILLATPMGYAQSTEDNIKSPIEYFNKRNKALSLAQSQNWLELTPIAENLTQHYQTDGDLY